jgi:hypothetical protein
VQVFAEDSFGTRQVLSGRVGEAAVEDMNRCVAGMAKLLRMLAGLGRGRGTFELTEEATGTTRSCGVVRWL